MNRVGFHPAARTELLESARYYEAQQSGLGRHFIEAVRRAQERIDRFPQLAVEIEPGIRQCRVQQFPYGLIYRARTERIEVIAVMHLHRQPGYWRERLP